MLLVIIDYVKSLIDWYVDYRLDKKIEKIKTAVPARTSDNKITNN